MAAKTKKCKSDSNAFRLMANKRMRWVLLLGLIFLGGLYFGNLYARNFRAKTDDNLVAFRIGTQKEYVDYDMLAALKFLEYKFKQAGFKTAGWSYAGKLYPPELERAGINVFLRGYSFFYDLRMNPDARNIFYLHRLSQTYREELRNYDYYLSSQKNVLNFIGDDIMLNLLPGGYIEHKLLKPEEYVYDVLYIYEFYNADYDAFIQRFNNPKTYSGVGFAALSDAERNEELKKARLVVYETKDLPEDDDIYVPYAAYDIISSGRPLLTNRRGLLTSYFKDEVWLFSSQDEMKTATEEALTLTDEAREKKGVTARTVLKSFMDMHISFMDLLTKKEHK